MDEVAARRADLAKRRDRRLAWLTLLLGFGAAAITFSLVTRAAGAGVAIGTLLAWINLRWLEEGANAMVRVSAARAGHSQARVSAWVYVKLFGRYALIALVLYVIVRGSTIPVVSVLGGLLALGAAAMVAGLYEVLVEIR